MNKGVLVVGLVSLFMGTACDEVRTETNQYRMTFLVADDRGGALGNIPIQVGQTSIGTTDALGTLRADVYARDGDRYPLHVPCPNGYHAQNDFEDVVFLATRGLAGEKNADIEIRILCKRQTKVAAVLIHADGHEGLPIHVDGVPFGQTGPGGFAHVRFEGLPSTQFEISLDTSRVPNLVPKNPRQEMQLGGEDGLFVFEPVFSSAEPKQSTRPKRKKRPRREQSAPKRKRPIRID